METHKEAHFLKPIVSTMNEPILKLYSINPKPQWPSNIQFSGWPDELEKWQEWVDTMHILYEAIWREAGIYDAIVASTYPIEMNGMR